MGLQLRYEAFLHKFRLFYNYFSRTYHYRLIRRLVIGAFEAWLSSVSGGSFTSENLHLFTNGKDLWRRLRKSILCGANGAGQYIALVSL